MPEFYTWVILLINQLEEIGKKQLSVLGSREWPNLLLNAPSSLGLERVFDSILGYKCEQEGCEARFDKWTLLVKHRKVHHQTGMILL